MDPISQGLAGATASQNLVKRKHWALATCIGFLAGMAADLDVVLRSASDPLFAFTFHRHFTHSIIFMPVGGLICALAFYFFVKRFLSFKQVYIYSTAGYATHALLDACTTYGTQLLWPFSDARIAWNTISIVDPIFTIPIGVFIGLGVWQKHRRWPLIAAAWLVSYILIGTWQQQRAEQVGYELAQSRGHQPTDVIAKPSFGNNILWKLTYQYDGHFYIDAARITSTSKVYAGDSIPQLDLKRDLPWLDLNSQQAKDIERFKWLSNGYIALSKREPNLVVDVRYSLIPHEIDPMWGIRLNPTANPDAHIGSWGGRPRNIGKAWPTFKTMLAGKNLPDVGTPDLK